MSKSKPAEESKKKKLTVKNNTEKAKAEVVINTASTVIVGTDAYTHVVCFVVFNYPSNHNVGVCRPSFAPRVISSRDTINRSAISLVGIHGKVASRHAHIYVSFLNYYSWHPANGQLPLNEMACSSLYGSIC